MKVNATMTVFRSFTEIAPYLDHKEQAPENPPEGIYLLTMYDDGNFPQHMMAVVIGDMEKKWQVTGRWPRNSPYDRDREIITVEFELDVVPLYVGGERVIRKDDQRWPPIYEVHSMYSPHCHCVGWA